jgi:hypothetical protein
MNLSTSAPLPLVIPPAAADCALEHAPAQWKWCFVCFAKRAPTRSCIVSRN